jgi:uncharacterized protein YcgL (UPF0745 family)
MQHIWKEKIKFTDDMILYIEKTKDYTKSLSELKKEFSKAQGYKIHI